VSDRIDIASDLAPDVILARLVAEGGWRDENEKSAFPYDSDSHKVIVRVWRNRFTVAIYDSYIRKSNALSWRNPYAPVCTGTIETAVDRKSRVRAHFRFNWVTRVFMTVWFGGIVWMILMSADDEYLHASGFYPPAIDAIAYGFFVLLLVSPLVLTAIGFMYFGFRRGRVQQDAMRKIIARATT